MGRILCLDYGQKRVGVAVTDPLQIITTGLTTIETKDVYTFLADYMAKERVDLLVVGLPRQMNGELSDSYRFIKPFLDNMKKRMPEVKIEMCDERFTSQIAQRAIIDGGVKKSVRRENKGLVDMVSASIILQSYLEGRQIGNRF
ncbi:MAG: Holliday junction resolvase RuvX [Rikenellaceae bacterium]